MVPVLAAPPLALVALLLLLPPPGGPPPAPPPPRASSSHLLAPRAASPDRPPREGAVWPLRPRPEVVAGFSPPAQPWGSGHRGADLLGRPGQPVRSAQAGTVVFAGAVAGVGVVVVRHGSTRSTYQPVAASVHLGQHVEAGQVLGTLALFGSHCFPRACLHWGLLAGDRYLDPLGLLGAAPVRLLPLG